MPITAPTRSSDHPDYQLDCEEALDLAVRALVDEAIQAGWKPDTLGALIDDDYRVALYCENPHEGLTCGFVKWLDLEKLAAKLGRDHGSMRDDLVPHL